MQKGNEGARKSSARYLVDKKALHLRAQLKKKRKHFEELVFKKDLDVSCTVKRWSGQMEANEHVFCVFWSRIPARLSTNFF